MSVAATEPDTRTPWRVAAWYGLVVMILVSVAGNLIPQIIALVTEDIKRSLGLSDTQIGAMRGIALTLVVAIASFPIAWLADRIDRRLVFVGCMVLWSVATIALGFSTNYAMLVMFAVGVAIGEAVLGPVTFAIIPDLFPPEHRMIANSVFFIAQLLGVAAGLSLGGSLLQIVPVIRAELGPPLAMLDPWRVTIMAAALPTIACIPLLALMRLNRRRTLSSGTTKQTDAILPFMRKHARTLFSIFIGFGLLGAANFIPLSWIAILIIRGLNEPAGEVGGYLGQAFAVGSIAGVVGANVLARLLVRRSGALTAIRVAQLGAICAALLTSLYFFAQTATHFYLIATAQIMASTGALVLSPTLTQNVTPARIRARVIAIGGIFYICFGAASPLLVGVISDTLDASGGKLLQAMVFVALPAFVLGALTLQWSVKTLPGTLASVKDEI